MSDTDAGCQSLARQNPTGDWVRQQKTPSRGAAVGAGCDGARTPNQSCSRRPASRKPHRSRIGYQVDHMTAQAAVPCRDTRCGVTGPHLPRKIHGKALSTLPRGMGGEWTGAAQSMRSHGPQFHAIARQHAHRSGMRCLILRKSACGAGMKAITASDTGRCPGRSSLAGRPR